MSRAELLLAVLLVATAGIVLAPWSARADRLLQAAHIARAEQHERENRPAAALDEWRRALAEDPSSRLSRRCEARIRFLSERSEAGFDPLARLMTIQNAGMEAQRADTIRGFAEQVARMPEGRVRRESKMLIAEAWATSIREPREAINAYLSLLREDGLDEAERRAAMSGLAASYSAAGDARGAAQALEAAGLSRTPAGEMLRLEAQRRIGRILARIGIALFAILSIVALVRAGASVTLLRGAVPPRAVLAGAFVCGVPLLIAHQYDAAATDTFSLLFVTGLAVLLLARIVGAAFEKRPPSPWFRYATAASAACGMLAVGYLLLDRAGGLLSIGL